MQKPISVIVALVVAMVGPNMTANISNHPVNLSNQTVIEGQENTPKAEVPKDNTYKANQENKQEKKNDQKQKKEQKQEKKNDQKQKKEQKQSGKYRTLKVKCVAYCPCRSCSEGYGRHTAIGRTATEGRTIAVDTRVIPLGSKVEIDGHMYVAEDVGGGVRGNVIDIFMSCHSKTIKWGSRTKTVKVYAK